MATAPLLPPVLKSELPDYIPARMVNEFVYCPRLFFYMWVEGIFRESADTLEGSSQHKRADKPGRGLPAPETITEQTSIHTKSVTLSSEALRVIAKTDIIEVNNGCVTPVDYKHGKPRDGDSALSLWPTDRVQLALQAIVLRENGYRCEEGVVYYQAKKQRVRVEFTPEIVQEAADAVTNAWALARQGLIPPPLLGSPKCGGCSLAPVCLPDEVNRLQALEPPADQLLLFNAGEASAPRKPAAAEVRRLITPRDDLKPVYLDTQGLRLGRSGGVLQVKNRDSVVREMKISEICQLNIMGNIQITTQTTQALCEAEVPICYFSQGGWFYGITSGLSTKNVFLRQRQFAYAAEPWFCKSLARQLTAGKIRNQRTLLMRNHVEPPAIVLSELKKTADRAESCDSLSELLGLEGYGAKLYFSVFAGMIKTEEGAPGQFNFDFAGRNRRPPTDPVNALLSLGYSVLAKDFTVACSSIGLDPMMGFYHQPRFGRPSLALDLMEPFRPLIVDSSVLSAINMRMIDPDQFIQAGAGVMLTPAARKSFYYAYELRMDQLVTHPLFEYRVTYRRLLEIQARLLGKLLDGEISSYPVFTTR